MNQPRGPTAATFAASPSPQPRATASSSASSRPSRSISAGRISAQADGELMLVGDEAWISNDLVIPGNVDFSVGRVAFTGNVTINGGVRSGFSVKCGGDLHIGGLVEVADIDCHGSLNSRGGIAGDGRATLAVGGRTHIVYLDGVHGRVGGDLEVERELVNCRLVIGGALSCAAATIMGGEIAVTGSLLVKSLGSRLRVRHRHPPGRRTADRDRPGDRRPRSSRPHQQARQDRRAGTPARALPRASPPPIASVSPS
jgi:hypothetical protein